MVMIALFQAWLISSLCAGKNSPEIKVNKPSRMTASRADIVCSCASLARRLFSLARMCSSRNHSWTSFGHSMNPTIISTCIGRWEEVRDRLISWMGVEFSLFLSSSVEVAECCRFSQRACPCIIDARRAHDTGSTLSLFNCYYRTQEKTKTYLHFVSLSVLHLTLKM